MRPLATTIALAVLVCSPAAAVKAEPVKESGHEILRICIVNDAGGEISVSSDGGGTWTAVGRVLRYTTRVNTRGYTASKWVPPGHVAATAVNAIHVTVGLNEQDDRGIIFSVLPREFLVAPKEYRSFLSPDSSIYTDIPAGTAIFGGGLAPFVGNPIYLWVARDELSPVEPGYVPAQGDRLVILVLAPEPYPVSVEFENWSGGRVRMRYADGSDELLGYVVRPVHGVGRFEGALYTGVGRVRANHAGVIDISTSPVGSLGAFQIIPFGHSISPEMFLAWERTQWMIVGPANDESPLWQGLMPLFYQHIRPDYLPGDLCAGDWESRLLERFLVDVETSDGYRPMSLERLAADATAPLPAWADGALRGVRRIRILFPLTFGGQTKAAD
ncbi:MAG: hypothetical protein ACE149_14875 [Armatimonadota bacterium]